MSTATVNQPESFNPVLTGSLIKLEASHVVPATAIDNQIGTKKMQPGSLEEALGWLKTPAQMATGGMEYLVDGFLPEGTTFLGGPSGHGKTWVALMLARSLYQGTRFLDHFTVRQKHPIVYLVPESGEKQFWQRLNIVGLGNVSEGFYVRTLTDGTTRLDDEKLLRVVRALNPVVFLDTAARFNKAEDENSASQNVRGLSESIFGLRREGAIAVIPLHHSPKELANLEVPATLEKTLRGSGELGAIADAVYCVRTSDKKNFRAEVTCVKDRDFEGPESFEIQGRPFITQIGDFKMIRPPEIDEDALERQEVRSVSELITHNPTIGQREIARTLNLGKNRVRGLALQGGWEYDRKHGLWKPRQGVGTVN